MGAADFNTIAKISGTKEDVLTALKAMYSYATDKRNQYNQSRNCPYLSSLYLKGENESGLGTRMAPAEDKDLLKFIEERNCTIIADASGPYGSFGFLDEVDLFHDMAEAAPNATISGSMSGFNPGGDHLAAFELKDGFLYCKYLMPSDDEDWDDEDEDWDEDDDDKNWEEEEQDWDEEVIYDPVKKKNVKK